MKRIKAVSVLLVLASVCATLLSCGGGAVNSKGNATAAATSLSASPESTASYLDQLGARDYGGKTINILDSNDHPEFFQNYAETLTGEPINDAMYNRDMYLEDKYNVKFAYTQKTPATVGTQAVENSIRAGSNEYDIIISTAIGGGFDKLSLDHMLYNLIDAPHLSLTSPWWSKLLYDNLTYNNKLYYSMGDISASLYGCLDCVFYNKKLMADYGITTDFYQLAKDGKWTFDAMAAAAKDMDKDLDGDGRVYGPKDFYGIAIQSSGIYANQVLTGAGVQFSTNTNGQISVNLDTQDVIDRITDLAGIFKDTGLLNWDSIRISFNDDLALFLCHQLSSGYLELRNMSSDFGILPMPKYNESQPSYISLANPWGTFFVGMPVNESDVDGTSFMMEAMAYTSYDQVRPQMCDNMIKQKVARDEQSIEMINTIFDTSYIDFGSIYDFGGILEVASDAVFLHKSYASAYANITGKIDAAVQKLETALNAN